MKSNKKNSISVVDLDNAIAKSMTLNNKDIKKLSKNFTLKGNILNNSALYKNILLSTKLKEQEELYKKLNASIKSKDIVNAFKLESNKFAKVMKEIDKTKDIANIMAKAKKDSTPLTNSEQYRLIMNNAMSKATQVTRSEEYRQLINDIINTNNNKYYNSLLKVLNNKKVNQQAVDVVKKYDINKIMGNEILLEKIRNDLIHNSKFESVTDKEFMTAILSKYTNQINKAHFMDNLNYYSERINLSPSELSKKLGVSISTVSDWYNGVNFPRPDKLNAIARILGISVEALTSDADYKIDDIKDLGFNYIPTEEILFASSWDQIFINWYLRDKRPYVALKIDDSSMSPKFENGDIVIFKRASSCPSGKNCIVIINDTYIKFRRFIQTEAGIILQPLNEKEFEPEFYSNKDILEKRVKVIGLPKEIRRSVE